MRILLTFFLCLLAGPALAQDAPITLTYQGALADAGGVAITGVRAITYRLYSSVEGGEPVWTEVHGQVDVIDGTFTSVLGMTARFDGQVMGAEQVYLGIQVGEDVELAPRMRVGGALRAQWAAVADHARDVRDEAIHPASVSIGDALVIDDQGRWVGDPSGLRGPAGADGAPGARGPQGLEGVAGPQGPRGTPGIEGAPGPQGPRGAQGLEGAAGPRGVAGEAGPQGAPGPAGVGGDQGPIGPAGADGQSLSFLTDSDEDGVPDWIEVSLGTNPSDRSDRPMDANEDGVPDALVGPIGPAGDEGARGELGPPGPAGQPGPAGPPGPDVDTVCRVQPLVQAGAPVPGAINLICGDQAPVRLMAFQCGNGRVDPAETCDDGNFIAGDGCDPRCLAECGNGRVDLNETCDDGNQDPRDACTDQCQLARCGDNIVRSGAEECDQGDTNSDDPGAECRSDCTRARCGDDIEDPDEECDDGNDVDTDACTNGCTDAICGDGIVGPGEACDDGNRVDADECDNECNLRDCPAADVALDPRGHVQYGFCWYLTQPAGTCDATCASVAGGQNLTGVAQGEITEQQVPENDTNATPIRWWYENGNPANWTGEGNGSWPGLGYAYNNSNFYGRTVGEDSAAFPNNERGAGDARMFACACLRR